jgi:hypothetical protein
MVPFAPIVTGITFVFTFHMRCIYIIIITFFISFVYSIYNYIPETPIFLGYMVLQLFCVYNLRYMLCYCVCYMYYYYYVQ